MIEKILLILMLVFQGFIFYHEYSLYQLYIDRAPVYGLCSDLIEGNRNEQVDNQKSAS